MSSNKVLLQPNKFYHIFNRGINSADLFFEPDNYRYFLILYDKYIEPVADTFAWVLMKNHFHLLIKIHSKEDIISSFQHLKRFKNLQNNKEKEIDNLITKRIYQQFSNLFNAYTKAINKRFNRTGALFESNFHRKEIKHIHYLKNLVLYIHYNPVHHGFCNYPEDYIWSSYRSLISFNPTKTKRETVIGWFNDTANFKAQHEENSDFKMIDEWLEVD